MHSREPFFSLLVSVEPEPRGLVRYSITCSCVGRLRQISLDKMSETTVDKSKQQSAVIARSVWRDDDD